MDESQLEKVADGRVFTGRQAVGLKLVDQLGDEKTAVAWLVAEKKVKPDLPVRDYKLEPRLGDLTFLRSAASLALTAVGLDTTAQRLAQAGIDQFGLDGMLALWRPAAGSN
jgi:protease-4